MAAALSATPELPEPLELPQPQRFLLLPPAERALSIAVAMLAVNETLSVGFIRDLQQRCETPVFRDVLDAILADEAGHDDFGWEYVARSLERFPSSSREVWKAVAQEALRPQRAQAETVLEAMAAGARRLDVWQEPELAALGLFSPERQALVFEHTLENELAPALRKLDLA
ncbi:MAG: hypothetical protein MJD61_05570 [Proteobacteria bacterium]|nr:hypothetical protein [Pseudomonadota bacterium]